MLDLAGLAGYIAEHHRRDLIRVETLGRYVSASDGVELDRYLAGEPEPDRAAKAGWLDRIGSDTAGGRVWRRLRLVPVPITDYVRYACEWGYTDNTAAGEQVRVLDLADAPGGAHVLAAVGDFYLLDDSHVAAMHYDAAGAFVRAEIVDEPFVEIYRAAARAGWAISELFDEWWPRHPEHHRAAAAR
ncbi:DUF6879 family protein [Pseudonocardia sp. MH-G8]|uniref:DUF6879 family protein n=1 Tax=Pseudonocardia sp. MH-G8 TaxID=1854588 RepID=UPI0013044979|nr:DUF6879 family protein [Pseudonocardia sp. MH-G8]